MENFLLKTDSYKLTHWKQYPLNTRFIHSYFECRKGGEFDKAIFFGLQYVMKKHLQGKVVTKESIDEAENFINMHLGRDYFNREGWEYILNVHNGKLPVSIRALPEGSLVNTGNCLFSVVNTDPKCYWLTNYIETLLVQVWYPITVATISYHCREIIKDSLIKAGASLDGLPFKLHDFGFRGVSSVESAGIGGMAHLINFMGSDTLEGIVYAKEYYNAIGMPAFSVPATEHSTITSWGADAEEDCYRNFIYNFPSGTISCVSDSYDIRNAIENMYGDSLKSPIEERKGKFVIRPDSGDPRAMLPFILKLLDEKFGSTIVNGYKLLNPKIGVIQGDGINIHSLPEILDSVTNAGYSPDNLVFGMGGGLLQHCNRDTLRCAYKCSAIKRYDDNTWYDVFKKPATDLTKASKAGLLKVTKEGHGFYTTDKTYDINDTGEMQEVFRNGEIVKYIDFAEIKARVLTPEK